MDVLFNFALYSFMNETKIFHLMFVCFILAYNQEGVSLTPQTIPVHSPIPKSPYAVLTLRKHLK